LGLISQKIFPQKGDIWSDRKTIRNLSLSNYSGLNGNFQWNFMVGGVILRWRNFHGGISHERREFFMEGEPDKKY